MKMIEDVGYLLKNFSLLDDFNSAYDCSGSYLRYTAIAEGSNDDPGNPDKTALILLRSFIEESSASQQKYIAALRFYNFGEMATLDIVSTQQPYHMEIFISHAKNVGWLWAPEEFIGK